MKIVWNLVTAEGALLITNDLGWRIPLEAAARDRFEVGPWSVEFQRDGTAISGFLLHRQRVWRLRFEKERRL